MELEPEEGELSSDEREELELVAVATEVEGEVFEPRKNSADRVRRRDLEEEEESDRVSPEKLQALGER